MDVKASHIAVVKSRKRRNICFGIIKNGFIWAFVALRKCVVLYQMGHAKIKPLYSECSLESQPLDLPNQDHLTT